jgi:transposase
MLEGGLQAFEADEDVVGTSRVRELERRVRELERLLGRKTMEVEILKEALDVARVKKTILPLPSWSGRRTVRNEGRGRHACGRPLEPDRAGSSPR